MTSTRITFPVLQLTTDGAPQSFDTALELEALTPRAFAARYFDGAELVDSDGSLFEVVGVAAVGRIGQPHPLRASSLRVRLDLRLVGLLSVQDVKARVTAAMARAHEPTSAVDAATTLRELIAAFRFDSPLQLG
jgi:hypothetical protein